MKPMNKRLKNILWYIFAYVLIIGGFGLSLYPTVSDLYGKYRDSHLMAVYDNVIAKMPEDTKAELLDRAIKYNSTLNELNGGYLVSKIQHPDQNSESEINTYDNMLKDSSSKIMGTVNIPKIAVNLPIYHWSTDSVLEKGIGHIHGSSLPVGNGVDPDDPNFSNIQGSHCLLIGHRGLPSLKLFSDLDDIDEGDKFYLKILGTIYAYRVCEIRTVLPEEVENLKIVPGKDLCTLITCTPYGVNTHRLLVTGERVVYEGESIEADNSTKFIRSIDPKTIFGLCFITFIVINIIINKRRKKKRAALKAQTSNSIDVTTNQDNDST